MSFFDVVVMQPILNLLMAIYGLIPDFGVSVIILTIIVRLLLWPLVKKQLRQSIAMRRMQPELMRVKQKYKDNRQLQGMAMMQLYKKHNISFFGSIGAVLVQVAVMIGIYQVVQLFVWHRNQLGNYTYDVLEQMPVIKQLIAHPETFNQNFLGMVDLTKHAISQHGVEIVLVLVALAAAVLQHLMSKQLSPQDNKKRLRDLLAEADDNEEKEVDQAELNAVMMRKLMNVFPFLIFLVGISLPGALAMYFATSNAVAYAQNRLILEQLEKENPTKKRTVKPSGGRQRKPTAKKRAAAAQEARITRIKAKE